MTEDDSSASNDIVEESFSSPECIIAASSAVISVRNKSMVALLKKSNNNLDEHDNSIQINFDQSDINYQQALNDGNAAVVLQVDVNNGDVMKSAEQSSSLAVDMASLPYTDAGVINENLVTITGEDGFVYQVENTKVEGGDAIFVSPDEEPQTICVMSDGSKVVRRMRIDGQPIFTLDDAFNNSLVQININERNVLPDGSEIFIGQDETGYTVQISPPGCDTAEQSSEFITDADVTASTISDTLHEGESVNAPAFITGDDRSLYFFSSINSALRIFVGVVFCYYFKALMLKIILDVGDLLDEGSFSPDAIHKVYVETFFSIFKVPDSTKLYVVPGNHDIGFHYAYV